ncbi:MAG: Metallo-dependent phosphatase-like protein [Benjaminiella poitrasii]|nr:MAG: Metallo-dependent phosphatase-like protein [Benjaminiella poitrasii]
MFKIATFLLLVSGCISFISNIFVVAELVSADRRIVALGDLHGDLANTLEILKFSNLIDDNLHWIGGDTIFVQTGDVLDRGIDTIKLYELIQNLRDEAPLYGGLVIPLLGNHEIMNLVGDWRYVYPGEPETFGGLEERKLAFKKDGFLGEYLTLLNMTTRVGSTVFCHGGITPYFSRHGIDWINDQTHESIVPFMESHGRLGDTHGVFGGDGPTWYRGYALDDEAEVCDLLAQALELLEANRMVVGHTVQHDGAIHTRCGGKVILIDIGISSAYGGRKGALEIRGNDVYAIYADRKEALPSPPPYAPSSEQIKKSHIVVHEEL